LIRRNGWLARIVIVLLLLVYAVPILWVVLTSFKSSSEVFTSQAGVLFSPTLGAYRSAIHSGLFRAAASSAEIALGTGILTIGLAVPAAYGLARGSGRVVLLGLSAIIILQMVPQTASLLPLYKVLASWHLLGDLVGVILADSSLLLPFAILILRPFFRAIPLVVEEAARVDGASRMRMFRSIVVPMARNGIATASTLIVLLAWGEFLYAINFLLSPTSYPLSALLVEQVSAYGIDWPGLMALAVLTSLPVLALFLVGYRWLRAGLAVGAVR